MRAGCERCPGFVGWASATTVEVIVSWTIRLAGEHDGRDAAAIYAPFCATNVVSFEYAAPTPDEMAVRIRAVTAHFPWLVLEIDGGVAGYAYASRHSERAAYQWAVNTAIYVGDGHRGRGIGRALYSTLFDLLILQGFFKACAGITLPNPASVGLHQAVGFELVGVYRGIGYKFGGWHDVAWYERPLQPEQSSPRAPLSVADVSSTKEWRDALGRRVTAHEGET
jgi:L-amino acid N-acyltransferase YncA